MSTDMRGSKLVIIGGGVAGTALAQCLQARLPTDWQITLVSREN